MRSDIVDDFIWNLRRQSTLGTGPWIDDLETVLGNLFASDDERAIEMSDKIRAVIERKHVPMQKRVTAIRIILKGAGVHL